MKWQNTSTARRVLDNHHETPPRDNMKALDQLREWYRRKHLTRANRRKYA
jgi:hypothetical protein